ncbi:unnamed protein product [Chrysodeixis includens]|uniref:Uncharacterized protein n=1 Tax=Chrysodeixis includens TaxID=689277 RepID=A0A9N8KW69_CHRIL|nr:unnamed protein product [Chrysodeixis includens]
MRYEKAGVTKWRDIPDAGCATCTTHLFQSGPCYEINVFERNTTLRVHIPKCKRHYVPTTYLRKYVRLLGNFSKQNCAVGILTTPAKLEKCMLYSHVAPLLN